MAARTEAVLAFSNSSCPEIWGTFQGKPPSKQAATASQSGTPMHFFQSPASRTGYSLRFAQIKLLTCRQLFSVPPLPPSVVCVLCIRGGCELVPSC